MKIRVKVFIGLVLLVLVTGSYIAYQFMGSGTPETTVRSSKPKMQPKNTSAHSYNDVNFAQQMIVQGQQGILISEAAYRSAANQEVRNIALKNMQQQKSDVNAYIALLEKWKESYLNLADYPEIEGHDLYPTFPGMADLTELKNIQTNTGEVVDKLYLTLAIGHAEGVLEMADTVGVGSENTAINKIKNAAVGRQKSTIQELRRLEHNIFNKQ
ncbi:DUF305 domain-containing protein [Candidatus Saccharibacteria bacterium]|jgi:uncharacterized protein (DUF305 family)|nr:DUF305 domain-containing protein [Candidatus Saccharibacteria bacterium]HPR09671.1 DUF305 domain-containing protein [Candidatus Saccharibacteria bacterium]